MLYNLIVNRKDPVGLDDMDLQADLGFHNLPVLRTHDWII